MPETRQLLLPAVGRHYTPRAIARSMVRACLESWRRHAKLPRSGSSLLSANLPRVLDPACGDGVFLQEAFKQLVALCGRPSNAATRLAVVDCCLAGTDQDGHAVGRLRRSLLAAVTRRPALAGHTSAAELLPAGNPQVERSCQRVFDPREAARVMRRRFLAGDALIGRGFVEEAGSPNGRCGASEMAEASTSAVDWPGCFPEVHAAGGFDIVIGNPPYVRERDAKGLFDVVAASPLGRAWRQPRMDYWHYFVHRGLDLLRPGGLLCFIVSSYWLKSRGARLMIQRLNQETLFEEFETLGRKPVFPGVGGWHMIFRLRKRQPDMLVPGWPGTHRARIVMREPGATSRQRVRYVLQSKMVRGGRIVLAQDRAGTAARAATARLAEQFETRQGIAENPPRITPRLNRRFNGLFTPGQGVFVLTDAELDRLGLSADERKLLRPYYQAAVLDRYHLPEQPTHWLLYLTEETASSLDAFPNVARHLTGFRAILDRRRETALGKRAWWQLHWPREETLFTRPRVLAVQMGSRPRFVFATRPAFVGFSVNLLLDRQNNPTLLAALCGLLNSKCAARWFACNAKHRGVGLEISGHLLREFPLPALDQKSALELARHVSVRQQQHGEAALATESLIDALAQAILEPL